jgi:hypothetical protein
MRLVLAASLSLFIALATLVPHVHVGLHGGEECALCVARTGDVAASQTPDVEPAARPAGAPVRHPAASPVCGAPLGAIPGQSPPRA